MLLLCCMWLTPLPAQDLGILTNLQKNAPYKVGFRLLETYDSTRVYQIKNATGNPFRPMQIAVWYPAEGKIKTQLTVEKYLRMGARVETLAKDAKNETAKLSEFVNSSHIDVTKAKRFLDHKLAVGLDMKIKPGDFPMVLYAPGSSAHWYDNFLLCQLLASQGYIVASAASRSLRSPGMSLNWEGVESQVRDMEYMLSKVLTLTKPKALKVNVIGRSWGAISALVFAIRNEGIVQSIASLDGTLSYNAQALFKDSPYPNADFVRKPLFLAVGKKRSARATPINRKDYFENVKYADAYQAEYDEMQHVAFGSYFLYYHYLLHKGIDTKTSNDLLEGYQLYTKHLLTYLNYQNQKETTNIEAIKGEKYQITIQKQSSVPLPNYQDFSYQLEVNGPRAARQLYKQAKAIDSTYAKKELFNAYYMNGQAYRYLSRGDKQGAIEILKLALDAFPKKANLYDSLGEMYYQQQSYKSSIKAYRKSLKLNPKNKNAEKMITKILQIKD